MNSFHKRFFILLVLVFAGFAALGFKLYGIQILKHNFYKEKGWRWTHAGRSLEAERGMICDRDGNVLALSTTSVNINVNLPLCSNRVDQIVAACAPLLRVNSAELTSYLKAQLKCIPERKSVMLRRNVPLPEWVVITNSLAGHNFDYDTAHLNRKDQAILKDLRSRLLLPEFPQTRIYPYTNLAAHVIGFASDNGAGHGMRGVYGIEKSMDQYLAGKPGVCESEQDASGNELASRRKVFIAPTNGARVNLTINLEVQKIAERVTAEAMRDIQPSNMVTIVMDVKTFEILAWCGAPSFNPQSPGAGGGPELWRNCGVSDMIEPGSIGKLFTLSGALDRHKVNLDTKIDCHHGSAMVGSVRVNDSHPYGELDALTGFAKSSNILHAKLAELIGPEWLRWYMFDFGMGRATGIQLPDESPGYIPPLPWPAISWTRAAYGQGIAVTLLQMGSAYCAIANEGRLMRPYIVRDVVAADGKTVASYQPTFVRAVVPPEIAAQMRQAMLGVTAPGGTGTRAASSYYSVAAKTGTAQIYDTVLKCYRPGAYYSSMAGFFPASAPRVCIIVGMNQPRNGYYAGTVVGPTFQKLVDQIGAALQIPSDKGRQSPGRNGASSGAIAMSEPQDEQDWPAPASEAPLPELALAY